MALVTINHTITATPSALGGTTPVCQVLIQNPTGNGAIRVGDSGVSATEGIVLAANTTLELGPFSAFSPISLNEIFISGTADEVVGVLYITP